MKKNLIVIGSGFGGIAAALRMNAKGYRVTLIEKHAEIGGRARVFKKDGFTYDAGPTVITAPYLLQELFTLYNKKISDYVTIKPLDLWYRFVFENGDTFDYSGNEEKIKNEIKKFCPEDLDGYSKLINFTEQIFNKGFVELSDKPFHSIGFMARQLFDLLKLKSYQSVYKFVSTYISNEKLRRIFSMHPLLVGGNPFSTTSIYALILYLEKKWGIHYAMGGTGAIINALEKLMQEEGITILKNSEVVSLVSSDSKITNVELKNKNILSADYIVCNADPPHVYRKLIGNKKNYSFLFNQKLNKMNYSMGLFVYYFGSKKKYSQIAHHTIVFGNQYENHLKNIFEKKVLSNDISFYLHRPTATDETMAPQGHDAFYVLVPVPNNLSKINWQRQGSIFKELVINVMDKTILPDIKKNIVSDFYVTPDYFEQELNTLHGSGFSIQPKFTQSAYFRFHNQSEIFNTLYFVGAGTHPGAGVPGVLSSAKVLDKLL